MNRSIALLRAVNVGGHHKISMVELRRSFIAAGCTEVATYIQSGNVVFTPPRHVASEGLEGHLHTQLRHDFEIDIPVMVRTDAEIADLISHNPYPGTEGTKLVVWFLGGEAAATPIATFDDHPFAPETLTVWGRHVYLLLPTGQGRSPLLAALDKLRPRVAATARNWNTVEKLASMS